MNASASTPRRRPTRRQLEVLRAYIAAGSIADAAHDLDIAESTARQHLSSLYRRADCTNTTQATYLLGQADCLSAHGGVIGRRRGGG